MTQEEHKKLKLMHLTKLFHDAEFDTNKIHFSEKKGDWRASFIRQGEDNAPYVRRRPFAFFLEKISVPEVMTELEVTGVSSWSILDESKIGTYFFSDFELRSNQLALHFIESMTIILEISDDFEVRTQDVKIMDKYVTFFSLRSPKV